MKILVISKQSSVTNIVRQLTSDNDVTIVETNTPEQAVSQLTQNDDCRLIVVSMASIWGGSHKWDPVITACRKRQTCIFVPNTCEISAITSVILNNQVVCPLDTPAGKKIFATLVNGLLLNARSIRDTVKSTPDRITIKHHESRNLYSNERDNTAPIPRFTRRQKQVFDLMVTGKSNREIASELKVTEGTIKIHSLSIYRTLGVSNRVHAVLRGQQLAKIDTDKTMQ